MFTPDELKVLLVEPKWMQTAKDEAKKLKTHMFGDKNQTAEYLNKIERYETDRQFKARKDNCTPNKALIRELLRPVDKIFSAKGGSKTYNLNTGSDTIKGEFATVIGNITAGMSVSEWLRQVWKDKYFSDPNGLIFMEWKSVNGENVIYPTFKEVGRIRNYARDGRQVLWVIFEPYEDAVIKRKLCRVVDADFDMIWDVTDTMPKPYTAAEPFVVPFDYCPAYVNSGIHSNSGDRMLSELDIVLDLADKYLRTTSVKNIHEFQHGTPIYWEYQSKCNVCGGTTVVNGKPCPACDGTGVNVKKDVADKKVILTPKEGETAITPHVAGFVEPSHETWNQLRTEQNETGKMIHNTFWGTHREEAPNETATGKFINQQPLNDKLADISEVFEQTEKWIVDTTGVFLLNELYVDCTILYGRRFLIETASALWDDYQNARTAGAPDFVLDFKLQQYITSELRDDIVQQEAMMKLMHVEPFVHTQTLDVLDMPIDTTDKMCKVYFSDWSDSMTPDQIVATTEDVLKQSLKAFVQGKYVEPNKKENEEQAKDVQEGAGDTD